ncbi:linoleate diol synthase (Linoleate (8R)-dioxygenase) [Coccidioides immitis H538.4]|uniref:Linoleate diol synthase (Linoleate (8R)-dioxygenase) n=1 Tax=Coccidioides immitis H538.4 TaxID=396776 RepID=A0A0J8RYF2_COCIT|nr:linoleate diol synthase (Linoleate (8R)-dioxygenase) [Coccidioides immitis H538.4]
MDARKSDRDTQSGLANVLSGTMADIFSQTGRIGSDIQVIREGAETMAAGGIIDDRQYTIEHIIQLAASLPNGSKLRDKLTDQFVTTLWNNLEHPPLSYLGDQFKFRSADGSNNNIMYPHLGASGSHYARSVVPQRPKMTNLPDPELIFERPPTKISSMLFHFATIIIHDIFRTDELDISRLKNSSYLDLGPLYGHDEEQQKGVRQFKDGLLKNDAFAEERVLGQPPGVCALLVAFNRFHNYVVGELATINERGRFTMPVEGSPNYEKALLKRDNDLFQTGRLVTCGLYINVILNDYLRAILNLNDNDKDSDWKLDPRLAVGIFDATGVPRGVGNQVSAEFNVIYRFHPAVSNNDEAWANQFFKDVFGNDKDPAKISVNEFRLGIWNWMRKLDKDPAKREFGGLKRQSNGMFKDSDLVKLLQESTEAVAGSFGGRNVPAVMKVVEMLGIEQGRQWGLATLNEFRAFFKLKRHEKFLDVNSDPSIAETLESLYGHPDDIELYTGVHVEEAKKPFMPGSGLCPGFTVSTAILYDAVALVRGDRFYTIDYSPESLTSFGFSVANSSFDVAKGGVMYKLLMRAFPSWYRPNSVYALFPFTTPEKNREVFTKHGSVNQYSFDRPSLTMPPIPVSTWKGVVDVLNDQARFKVPWGPHTFEMTKHDYMLSGDSKANAEQREIGNLVHANFAGHFFQIPLQSASGGPDSFTEQELYDSLAHLFAEYGARLVERLSRGRKSVDEVTWTIIPTAAASVATQAQGWAQMFDLYMSDKYYSHWKTIEKLSRSDAPEDFEKLKRYALEGLRLATPAYGVLRVAATNGTIQDGSRTVSYKPGDVIFTNFMTAGADPSKFPDPEAIKLDRPEEDYIHHGWGPHACLGRPFVTTAAASMLRVFGRLDNVRRAPGPPGEMKSKVEGGVFKVFLTPDGGDWNAFPCTKRVLFDGIPGCVSGRTRRKRLPCRRELEHVFFVRTKLTMKVSRGRMAEFGHS